LEKGRLKISLFSLSSYTCAWVPSALYLGNNIT